MPVWSWSSTAASNGTADTTINFQEGQAPSTVNNSARALMAAVAQYRDDIGGALTTTGTGTAYVLATNSGYTSTTAMANQQIAFVPNVTNTGACTINVDGLGAIPLHIFPGVALPSGTIIQGTPYLATYYATAGEFILHGGFSSPYSVPLGGMIEYIGSTAPNSAFVLPYGQAISRTVYATLYFLIGTTYGSGDGLTTFNIPDLRGCVVACPDNMGGTAASRLNSFGSSGTTIGAIGGSQAQTIAQANLPNVTFAGAALSVSASGSYSGTTATESNGHTHTFSG